MKVITFTGSLRKGSFNQSLMRAAVELAPQGMEIEIFDVGQLPLFNQDLEMSPPAPVAEFKKKIEESDAVLFVTPEFNYSVPGVLKNAIDWASRPYGKNSFEDKPAAIMGTAGGSMASGRAQYHLRQMFVWLNIHTFNKPEVLVPTPHEKFDENGKLTDEKTREKVKELLDALVVWVGRLK